MNVTRIILFFMLYCCNTVQAGELPRFAVAPGPVPVYSSPQAAAGLVLQPDRCGQIRQLEFIALPGTVFKVVTSLTDIPSVLQLSTSEYTPRNNCRMYAAKELLRLRETPPPSRTPPLPQVKGIQQQLRSAVGLPYVWGGNWRGGIQWRGQRRFAGLDCSGLLYEATGGYTPRNTDQLLQFGVAVPIEGLGSDALLQLLRPLDLIVWMGHVVIVLDQENTIESILRCDGERGGVIITPLKKRLEQLMKQRRPIDQWPAENRKAAQFVVRRWI